VDYWYEDTYKDSTGRILREYKVTKKGCELIAHKTEGEKGVLFTVRYMDKFEEMEKAIKCGTQEKLTKDRVCEMIYTSEFPEKVQAIKEMFPEYFQHDSHSICKNDIAPINSYAVWRANEELSSEEILHASLNQLYAMYRKYCASNNLYYTVFYKFYQKFSKEFGNVRNLPDIFN